MSHMGYFHMGSSLALEFNLAHLFLLLKNRSCSDIMLAVEIHIGFVDKSAVYGTFRSYRCHATKTDYNNQIHRHIL